MVFIEAAACECAIVTSDIAPMNKYLTNMENAFLVPEYENPEKIAEAVKLTCTDSDLVRKIRHNARKVGEKFEKTMVDKQEVQIYEEVIRKGTTVKKRFDK